MLMIVIGAQLVKTPFWRECTNQLTVRSHFGRIIHNFGTNGQILAYTTKPTVTISIDRIVQAT